MQKPDKHRCVKTGAIKKVEGPREGRSIRGGITKYTAEWIQDRRYHCLGFMRRHVWHEVPPRDQGRRFAA